ncbi:phosphotransferase family protein [Actinopolymorpha singaporensis]|uniref:Ser/Thr protein kinase RdoA involved in Cpx stress response, MazF antagonist n=1 Tax=Actinopolymorpha singaporensis TaxID=117157 RepID=A0A1H1UBV0_9ACTN|nr:phosphotransferase [Actinopolymorpha singaporensis]SDS69954.1 Ser/Thr protein kinase RdoA involved in Cpx stress response, MazF antagonist [Actinopolymorpha singaporensis]
MTASQAGSVPHGETAVRPQWADLPEPLRDRIAERLGGDVVATASQGSGFTPGFASRLAYGGTGGGTGSGTGGTRRAFVKAVSADRSPAIADSYRAEARIAARIPSAAPVPALRWTLEEFDWVVLCFDDVPGRPPARPWKPNELTDVLTALTALAEVMTPAPEGLVVPQAGDWLAEDFGYWRRLARASGADGSTVDPQVAELATLEEAAPAALAGDSVVHCDLRDDNVILGDDGRVWFCDWNWPSRGPAWLDLVTVLISACGDGYDATALLSAHPLGENADGDAVDAVLAGLAGYFADSSLQPAVSGSPYLRAHQAWYAQATLSWLALRRGWVG